MLDEAGVESLLANTIETAVRIGAIKKSEFEHIIPDTTVQVIHRGKYKALTQTQTQRKCLKRQASD